MPQPLPLVTVMGVSGSGKTTVGAALAQRLGVPFADADDFHPAVNIAKMSAGVPLTDDDRVPWLQAIGTWQADRTASGAVVTCSALRRSYRDGLRAAAPAQMFVHLTGSRRTVARRVAGRPGHFMPAALVDSQYDTLEPLGDDEYGITLDLDRSVDDLVAVAADAVTGADRLGGLA
ncbi:gluconokinase [Pseudonocardia kongjuensis]|uniref:Gluconokinase n=1 Tax=Pseudonocardia kongjuensis TaxID=102227 RepID=A0ABN1XVP4_9PSEU